MMEALRQLYPLVCAVAFCAILAACTTPEQQAAIAAQRAQEDYDSCIGYGFRPNTDGFRNCLMQLDLERKRPVYYPSNPYGVHTGFSYHHWY